MTRHVKRVRPQAIAQGALFTDEGTPVRCYVLDDDRTVVAEKGLLRALGGQGPEEEDWAALIAHVPEHLTYLVRSAPIVFEIPGEPKHPSRLAQGREVADVTDLCKVFLYALATRELTASASPIGLKATERLVAWASIGLESAAHQAVREVVERE